MLTAHARTLQRLCRQAHVLMLIVRSLIVLVRAMYTASASNLERLPLLLCLCVPALGNGVAVWQGAVAVWQGALPATQWLCGSVAGK